jgi:hypothetical protein
MDELLKNVDKKWDTKKQKAYCSDLPAYSPG